MNAAAGNTAATDTASWLDRPYDQLERLPRGLWLPVLVAAVGSREARLAHAAGWLQALAQGVLPEAALDFDDAEALAPLRVAVGELGLPALCRGTPALPEQVLRSLLWQLDRLTDLQPRASRAEAIARVREDFLADWRRETRGLEDQLELLRDLAGGAHLSWDRLRGALRSRAWQVARQAAERLQELPQLAELLQQLGRSRPRPSAPPRAQPEPLPGPASVPLVAIETRIPGAPGELTGIRAGASLAQMLPSEAMLRLHPIGRRLWRARHAEGRLLAHDSQAVLVDWRCDPAAVARASAAAAPPEPLAHGPIILCLDTSASMRGAPENIARAVVIAAVRAAHASRRGCLLIAFGGAGELVEHDLTGTEGLERLLEVMGQAFDGGTDLQTPIERAVQRVHEARWASADLVVLSDGEFGCVPATLALLDQARRERGLRVQGILVGDRETLGLLEVCDAIAWVRDWRRHADDAPAQVPLPVHSKSLTAIYFPNALSPRAARHHGVALPAASSPSPSPAPAPDPTSAPPP